MSRLVGTGRSMQDTSYHLVEGPLGLQSYCQTGHDAALPSEHVIADMR
jgi:hypothetical protein